MSRDIPLVLDLVHPLGFSALDQRPLLLSKLAAFDFSIAATTY
jgi:hypothetical protein